MPPKPASKLPRMADFALWVTACETALWPAGTFSFAYCGNRDEAVEAVIDADPIAAAVRALTTARTQWTGTASELLTVLAELAGERVAKSKAWPDNPRALAGRLRRVAAFLRKIGIEIRFRREGRARTRIIRISAIEPSPETRGMQTSASSAPSAFQANDNPANGFAAPSVRTVAGPADGAPSGNGSTVRVIPLKTDGETDVDGADANHPAGSELETWPA